jgi:hypothetical protein
MLLWMRFEMVGPKVRSWSEPIQIRNLRGAGQLGDVESGEGERYQLGLWMQVERAAPMPVPVQIRMPRRNMADACPTPATGKLR